MIILPYSFDGDDDERCFFHALSVLPENKGKQLSGSNVILVVNPMGVCPSTVSRRLLFPDPLVVVDREKLRPALLRTALMVVGWKMASD